MALERYFPCATAGVLSLELPQGLEQGTYGAIDDPLQRLNRALAADDLPLIVGTCKDLAEAVAKVVLAARGEVSRSGLGEPKSGEYGEYGEYG